MECPNCHAPVKPNAQFCNVCGYQLKQTICPRCGAPVKPGHHHCGNCGFELRETSAVASTGGAGSEKRSAAWIVLAAIVGLLLLVGGAGAYHFLADSKHTPISPPFIAEKTATPGVIASPTSISHPVSPSPQPTTPAPVHSPTSTMTPSLTPTSTMTPLLTPTSTMTPLLTPTSTMTPTPLPPGEMKAVFDKDERFNVRMGPGYHYPIVDMVKKGAVFNVIARTEDAVWLQAVDEQGREVWVYSPLLETNYPPETAPVATSTPIPPTNYVVADSVADFRTEQGATRWYYLASKSPGSLEFDWMPQEGKWFRWTKGGRSPEMRLSKEGSYPSWNSDAIRLWSNFYEGTLRIEGKARKEPGAGRSGNGVDLRIVQRRTDAKSGEDVLVRVLWQGSLGPYDAKGFTFHVDPFEVKQRDAIYFITSARGDDAQDNTIFTTRIFLMNPGGVEITPTPAPNSVSTPPSIRATPRTICFAPHLRQYERSHGGLGEAVGYVYKMDGHFSGVRILVEGAPGPDQWQHEFLVSEDGGYEMTALSAYGPPFYYTMSVVGLRIRSTKFKLEYPEGPRRAVVDWNQVSCK